jgi:MHS family alpha-ketoglutarate permease-like MFS transporter
MSLLERSKSYFRYMIFVLMLVQILDSFSTIFPGAIPTAIANEFLPGLDQNTVDSILAFASGIVSIGLYFLFFSQYLADKLGRKLMLSITVFGMAIACLGMFLSPNFVTYYIFVFVLNFFFSSDIWLIYVNEETKSNKRAFYSNIILIVGLVGAFVMVITRLFFITETNPNWRAMTIFPMLLGFPLTFLIYFTLKETSKYEQMRQEIGVPKRNFKEDLISIFKTENKKPYLMLLVIAFVRGTSGIYILLFEKYISQYLPQNQITLIFFATVFMVVVAYLINGLLADKIGRKPLLYLWSALAPISVLIWVFAGPQGSFMLVLLGYSLSHISVWGSLGIVRLINIELLPTDRRGTGVGFRNLIGSIGGTIGLLLSSVVILFIGLGPTFIIFVMANFIVIPLTYFYIKETKGVELAEIK